MLLQEIRDKLEKLHIESREFTIDTVEHKRISSEIFDLYNIFTERFIVIIQKIHKKLGIDTFIPIKRIGRWDILLIDRSMYIPRPVQLIELNVDRYEGELTKFFPEINKHRVISKYRDGGSQGLMSVEFIDFKSIEDYYDLDDDSLELYLNLQ